MKPPRHISTLCRMCDHGCGIEVTVLDGDPVGLKGARTHPFNKGWLCVKGHAALDLFRSPQRLTSPLIRRNGVLKAAGWDEALSLAAGNLHRIKDRYGPESLAIYYGEGVGHQEIRSYMKRFANVFGTPNFCGVGSICNTSRTIAETLTFGGLTKPDIPRSRLLMVWGGNPLVSNEPLVPGEIGKFKKQGGRLIVVDPRQTETAAKADIYLPIKPGRDESLILNLLHVILKEDLWDNDFTEKWVHGFDTFRRTVREERFSPEKGASLTGIPVDLVRSVARAYAETRPAGIFAGNGLEHHGHGVNTVRLLAILKAITGNLDIPGGDLFTPRPKIRDITTPLPEPTLPAVGSDKFPVFCQARKEAHALSMTEAILDEKPYPIKGMIISGGNPSLQWPDSGRVREALRKLEFLMVIDVVRSPDSAYAGVVLPACTFLERDEHRINPYQNLHMISLRRKVVEPAHGLPDQMIWVKLAQHMGFGEYFPWQTCREGIDDLLGDLGVTYGDLVSNGGIYEYEKRRYRKYESEGFSTPTGKVEIFSERLKIMGYDPSPIREGALNSDPDDAAFPLCLSTGGNLPCYVHWQYRYIPRLRKMAPEPVFEVHPDTAREYGLTDGRMGEIRTRTGSIRLKTHVTNSIRPDTLHLSQGWETANANDLTGHELPDPISGFPNLKSLRCSVGIPEQR
ncbi:MAG: molybdopterin-dependent oxidoreductase [Pseudomonadota bacterium]